MSLHSPNFVLNFATGSVSFAFSPEAAEELQSALQSLRDRLRVSANTPAQPAKSVQEPLDYRRKEEGLLLEVFCNPNIWASPHAAKVLITLRTDRLRLSTEAELPRIQEDLSQFLEAC
jgi:hypothetical protein